MYEKLLQEWCDALVRLQVTERQEDSCSLRIEKKEAVLYVKTSSPIQNYQEQKRSINPVGGVEVLPLQILLRESRFFVSIQIE